MPPPPEVQALLDQLASVGAPPVWEVPIEQTRASEVSWSRMGAGPLEPVGRIEDRSIPGPAGAEGIPIRVYTPRTGSPPFPVIVWFHGGGWVCGSIETHDPVTRRLANEAEAVVVSVGYRLAPEHRFPAAAEDCWTASCWAHDHARELAGGLGTGGLGTGGLGTGRESELVPLAVAGDSAGGNLAAATALMAKARGRPPLHLQALVYPVTDSSGATRSYEANGRGFYLEAAAMRWFWDQYLANPDDASHPWASPISAGDLSGLPAAVVITAEYDPLRDEGEAYGARLRAAGVPVTISRYEGMIHGFLGMRTLFPDSDRAMAELAAGLQSAFASAAR